MNSALNDIIKAYSMQSHAEYSKLMHGFSKDMLVGTFTDLLTQYINDKNSSTLREFVTVSVAGYQQNLNKIGFNGYKHVTGGTPVECEAKPKNVSSSESEARYNDGKNIRKLNGGGNFTDYTPERLQRDVQTNPNMLVSGFVDGQLIYLLEFPFSEPTFTQKLDEQLKRHFGSAGRQSGRFLRAALFDYRHFIDSPNLRTVYVNRQLLKLHKSLVVGKFYDKLSALTSLSDTDS